MEKSELKKLVSSVDSCSDSPLSGDDAANFVKLDCGFTHYDLRGEGEAVVLVHGYATPLYIYDGLSERLASSGYKVLRYDLLGRGLSQRVKADYTPELFAAQLDQLTKAVLGEQKFHLVGTSMGGAIVMTYAALMGERINKLVLLAPAGADTFRPPFYMRVCKLPILGNLIFKGVAKSALVKKCASELKYRSAEAADEYIRKFAYCAKYSGFLDCTLSSLRHTILAYKEVSKAYAQVGKSDIDTLCVWGTDDKTMPYYQQQRVRQLLPKSQFETYEGSGHIFVYDESERTAKSVLKFLRKE